MKSVVASAIAVVVLAGSALAAIPSTTSYKLATEPLITGKVANVDDHNLVVDTEQGNQVSLAMDSHTMVPTDLAPGMHAWVEFRLDKKTGKYYAKRVIPMRDGMNRNRELAYSTLHGSGTAVAMNASMEGGKGLPQTASNQPLLLLLGSTALAAAGALALSRRSRRA